MPNTREQYILFTMIRLKPAVKAAVDVGLAERLNPEVMADLIAEAVLLALDEALREAKATRERRSIP